ncbi:uncharacterized protein LOC144543929 [Carex rostrata]
MNSTSFSPLPTFIQKHGSKSKSHRILSLRQNFLAPKFYQCNTSKCKIQPKYSKPLLVAARGGNAAHEEPPSPLQDLVHKFYTYINSKDVRRLEKLFDSACVIEDEAYYQPLEGQKVHKFFEKLTQAMGQNVVFAIDDICEGDESIAVTWHLEWNGEFIPFTKGCSLYTCSEYGGTFRIRRANVFMESPFKPGDLALEMLKIIIALFDRFPKLARSFLRKPATLVFYVVNLYKFIVEPLMRPVIAYYSLMLAYAVKILTTVVTIIYSILKLFF